MLHSGQTKTPIFVAQRLNARMLDQAKDLKRSDKFLRRSPSARARTRPAVGLPALGPQPWPYGCGR
ncbi:hypothetical protein [Comamonas sp. JC664]|uniref:hypothetical protein n=1 Tax=Comamonas sp. JC664 TaxID=2801917 RepID=UPI00361AAA48